MNATRGLTSDQRRALARAVDAIPAGYRAPQSMHCPAPALMRAGQRRARWPHGACPVAGCTLSADVSGRCTLHRERVKLKLSDDHDIRAVVQRGVMTFTDARPPMVEPPPAGWHATLPPHAPCNGCPPGVHARRGSAVAYVTADRRCRLCGCTVPGVVGPPDVATTTCTLCLRFSRHRPRPAVRVTARPRSQGDHQPIPADPTAECWKMIERARAHAGQRPLAITNINGARR